MIDTIGYLARIAARYWPIPIVVLVAALIVALFACPQRFAAPRGLHAGLLAFCAIALLALAAPTWRALTSGFAALSGAAPASPTSAYQTQVATLTLEGDRPIIAQIWFPAEAAHHSTTPQTCAVALSTLRLPTAISQAPLLLYDPGWGGARDENARTAELLARQGYIVVAIDDIAHDAPYADAEDEVARLGQIDMSSAEAAARTQSVSNKRLALQAAKASETLDRLAQCFAQYADENVRTRVNFDAVGVWGFSLGGAVGAELATREPRIAAVVNLDGGLLGAAAQGGVSTPYLAISSDFDPLSERQLSARHRHDFELLHRNIALDLAQARRPNSTLVLVNGATHDAFTDGYAEQRSKYWLLLSPRRAQEIKAHYVLSFFDAHLRNTDDALWSADPSPYAEVIRLNEISARAARSATAP
jgi:dienelactone hydrolase